jgi:hypothetical protein
MRVESGPTRLNRLLKSMLQPPGLKPEIDMPSVPAGLKTRSPGLKSGATQLWSRKVIPE